MIAGLTLMLLAACDSPGDGNATLAEANSSGNEAAAAVENAVQQSDATPLQKEQALALMKQRHENYEKIGDAMKAVSRELKGESSDLGKVRAGAATIAQLAPQVSTWFPAGTGPDVGKTEARAAIWEKPEDFAAKSRDFQQAAAAFDTAAKGSDLAAIRSAHGNLGKSCKACHDLYREEE
ncbi:MAG TPA: cytochrome c [Allosphingosinicella sp.]|jgi:cytochrome c556|nr:cytochrome c [Allosphingosinicella sp.]